MSIHTRFTSIRRIIDAHEHAAFMAPDHWPDMPGFMPGYPPGSTVALEEHMARELAPREELPERNESWLTVRREDRLNRIMAAIRKDGHITRAGVAELCSVTLSGVDGLLRELRARGLVKAERIPITTNGIGTRVAVYKAVQP